MKSMHAMQCVLFEFWQDSDINGSDAMRVFISGQRNQCLRCNACYVYFGGTAILMVAMQCVFFMAGQRYQW